MMKQLLAFLVFCIPIFVHAEVSLHEEIRSALKSGEKSIRLKHKEYFLEKPLSLNELNGIEIDGNHAKIVMKKNCACLIIIKSHDLTVRSLTIDYDPLPYTQGTVTKVDGKIIECTIDRGYSPAQGIRYSWNCHAFTPDGRFWKKNQKDIYAEPIPIDQNRLQLRAMSEHPNLKPGDRLAIAKYASDTACIEMRETERLTFDNLTIYASPGCVFRGYHCDGDDILKNIVITRGPAPSEASQHRLLSSNHDAVHYGYCRKGAKLLNCDFGWMGDDSLNFHGKTSHLAEVTGLHTFNQIIDGKATDSIYLKRFRKGDKIRILDSKNFRILGEYSFVSYRRIDKIYPKELRDVCFPYLKDRPEDVQSTFEITVAEELMDFPAPCRWDAPNMNCREFRISDCFFHDHRAYGLRIMASDGIVENCRFERIKGPAIAVGAQYSGWGEAGWSNDVVVQKNSVKECGFASYAPGAISVFVQLSNYNDIAQGNRNIGILENVVENCSGAGIFVMAADGITISHNRISDTALVPFKSEKPYDFKGFAPVWILNSMNVIQTNNKIQSSY